MVPVPPNRAPAALVTWSEAATAVATEVAMLVELAVGFGQAPAAVFPFLADPTRYSTWLPGVRARLPMHEGAPEGTTRWRAVDRVGPLWVEFVEEVQILEMNRRVVSARSAPLNSRSECILEPRGPGSLLQLHLDARPTGPLTWLDLVPDRLAAAFFRVDLRRLRDLLDRRSGFAA